MQRAVEGFAIIAVSFLGTSLLLQLVDEPIGLTRFDVGVIGDPCPDGGETVMLPTPFVQLNWNAYAAPAPSLGRFSDTEANLHRSKAVVCENKRRLGPAHSAHTDIATLGNGRFSHYQDQVVFSSSDNSDPNSNGRDYLIVLPSRR